MDSGSGKKQLHMEMILQTSYNGRSESINWPNSKTKIVKEKMNPQNCTKVTRNRDYDYPANCRPWYQ